MLNNAINVKQPAQKKIESTPMDLQLAFGRFVTTFCPLYADVEQTGREDGQRCNLPCFLVI